MAPNEISLTVSKAIQERILADLRPSRLSVYRKVALAMMAGGFISLTICGQFGIGMSPLARNFNLHLHAISPLACTIICATIFTLIPILILRLLSGYHLFNVITRQHSSFVSLWIFGFGVLLAYHGQLNSNLFLLMLWICTAILVFKIGSRVLTYANRIFYQLYENLSKRYT
ncbi:MAG: hypothetical protein R3B45_13515 [Bdellovibrionota bacterium]